MSSGAWWTRPPESLQIENNWGNLPLHLAAKVANLDVVTFLVKRRPESLHIKNKKGKRPVHMARYRRWNDDGVQQLFAKWDTDPDAIEALSSGRNDNADDASSAEEEAKVPDDSPAAEDSDSDAGGGGGGGSVGNQEATGPPPPPLQSMTSRTSASGRWRVPSDDAVVAAGSAVPPDDDVGDLVLPAAEVMRPRKSKAASATVATAGTSEKKPRVK